MVPFNAHRELLFTQEANLIIHKLLRTLKVVPCIFLSASDVANHILLPKS